MPGIGQLATARIQRNYLLPVIRHLVKTSKRRISCYQLKLSRREPLLSCLAMVCTDGEKGECQHFNTSTEGVEGQKVRHLDT